jgi:hypothetical protein
MGPIDLLPWWVRLCWVIAFCWIAAEHTVHVALMKGQPRAWHFTHIAMAAGMFYMFTPWLGGEPGGPHPWEVGFLVLGGLIVLFVLVEWVRRRPVNLLWFLQLVAMGAMAYMYALMDPDVFRGQDVSVATLALAAYYVLEAAGWSKRAFAEADDRRLSWIPFQVGPTRGGGVCANCLCGPVPVRLALSGTVMSLGMTYMFLAMDPGALNFFDRALQHGRQPESWVALAGCAVVFLLVLPWPRAGHAVPGPSTAEEISAARIFGPIRSAGGQEIGSGIPVVLLGPDGLPRAKTRTSPGGRYEFRDIPAGEYTLTVLTTPPTARPIAILGPYPTECPIQLNSIVGTAG